MAAALTALGVVCALLGVLVVGLLRSHADILRALHDLGIGDAQLRGEVPLSRRTPTTIRTVPGVAEPSDSSSLGRLHDITGALPAGGAAQVALTGTAGTTLLAFLSTGCSTCQDFWRAFSTAEVDQVPGDGTRVVVVTKGAEEESPAEVAELAPPGVTTVMSSQAWDDYDVPVAPYFLLVDGSMGVIGEGASASWAQVVDLLGKALADRGITSQPSQSWTRRDLLMGRDRERRVDRELADAGIEPGSPELYRPVAREQADG
jgi:hypothetical protein